MNDLEKKMGGLIVELVKGGARPTQSEVVDHLWASLSATDIRDRQDELLRSYLRAFTKSFLRSHAETGKDVLAGQLSLMELDIRAIITVPEADDIRHVWTAKASWADIERFTAYLKLNRDRVVHAYEEWLVVVEAVEPYMKARPTATFAEALDVVYGSKAVETRM